MGQGCSSACGNGEPDALEMNRTDSPDPVMYDLMCKSIQATTPNHADGNAGAPHSQNYKIGKRKPPGQNHLLYRNSEIETMSGSIPIPLANNLPDPIFGASGSGQQASAPVSVDSGSWLPQDRPVPCPTRLLIRRHPLRVVEEGGGTHIYAIRYPEDTPDKVISEQATLRPESARQEQCPPKKKPTGQSSSTTSFAKPDSKVPGNTTVIGGTVDTKAVPKAKTNVGQPLMEGTDIFSAAAMASHPRQEGKSLIDCNSIDSTLVSVTDSNTNYIVPTIIR